MVSGEPKEITVVVDERGIVVDRFVGVYRPSNVDEFYDLTKLGIALPGFIDIHAHLRGLELSYKEDEYSGCRAAAVGGFTLVVDMPNTIPRVDRTSVLVDKRARLLSQKFVDVGIYIAPPKDSKELEEMMKVDIVAGIKLFPNDYEALSIIKLFARRSLIVVHPEDPSLIIETSIPGARWRSRPIECEVAALDSIAKLGQGLRIHITHATNPLTVVKAKRMGFTVDTCPHYLVLSSRDEYRLRCIAKVNPPLRSPSVGMCMINVLSMVDAVSTDHAPHSEEEKHQPFDRCPSGISSIDLAPSIMLDLVVRGLLNLESVIRLMSLGPARILGLEMWGCIDRGCIASYTIASLRREFRICREVVASRARLTPYEGTVLRAQVVSTVIRGHVVAIDREIVDVVEPQPIATLRVMGCARA